MLFLCSISFFAQLNGKCIPNRLFSFVTRLYFEKESQAKWQAERYVHDTRKLCLVHNTISNLTQLYKLKRKNTLFGKRCALKSIAKLISTPWALPLKG